MKKIIGTIALYAATTSFLIASDANSIVTPEDGFKVLDLNQDMVLNVEEAANDVALFNVFSKVDSDGDQQISKDEYNHFIENKLTKIVK